MNPPPLPPPPPPPPPAFAPSHSLCRYYTLVLEYERNKQHARSVAASAAASGCNPFVDVLRVRELTNCATLELDVMPHWTVAALKDRLQEVYSANRSCVSVMAGCEVLADGVVLQVTCCDMKAGFIQ